MVLPDRASPGTISTGNPGRRSTPRPRSSVALQLTFAAMLSRAPPARLGSTLPCHATTIRAARWRRRNPSLDVSRDAHAAAGERVDRSRGTQRSEAARRRGRRPQRQRCPRRAHRRTLGRHHVVRRLRSTELPAGDILRMGSARGGKERQEGGQEAQSSHRDRIVMRVHASMLDARAPAKPRRF
jgi:hypothetical protein